jgi:CRISPR-associated protein Csh1
MLLDAMRRLALDFLHEKLEGGLPPEDPDAWFRRLRDTRASELLPLLLEPAEKIERVYVIAPVPGEPDKARLSAQELSSEAFLRVPFCKPTGSQSAAVGPVFKRTWQKVKGPGPTVKIQNTSVKSFEELSQSPVPWAAYFAEVLEVLRRPVLLLPDQSEAGGGLQQAEAPALAAAVQRIAESGTVYLTVADARGRWPGDRKEYLDYLAAELAQIKYSTAKTPPHESGRCPLCGAAGTTLYPNAVKGAGLNFGNVDRQGAFPGVALEAAWKGFALCLDCADLLFVYKNHVAPRDLTEAAGKKALVVPATGLHGRARRRFLDKLGGYVRAAGQHVAEHEEALLRIAARDPSVTTLSFVWAKFGQLFEDFQAVVADVLPSRLRELSEFNLEADTWRSPIFPGRAIASFDLGLSCLYRLFHRPGGRKAAPANASQRLFQQKVRLCAALYHRQRLPEGPFFREWLETARFRLDEASAKGSGVDLLLESTPRQAEKKILTTASWMRHFAKLLYYLRLQEVFPVSRPPFEPQLETLRPYFGPESGIDSPQKAFAFLLGILYGKLLQVQGARGLNVSANALRWLRRLTLRGRDLPDFYNKVREKLLAYETENSPAVRALVQEIGRLGARLGDRIELDETQTSYFLLLGQSLTTEILPSRDRTESDGGAS